ncbi:unnamed protein product [Dicrocoelium dendriticum]|nr:unnamed protein product [Dicrocoelium dendriticum]
MGTRVGNKKDLRNDESVRADLKRLGLQPVSYEAECSAKTKEGVRKVFETATRAVLESRKSSKRRCKIL